MGGRWGIPPTTSRWRRRPPSLGLPLGLALPWAHARVCEVGAAAVHALGHDVRSCSAPSSGRVLLPLGGQYRGAPTRSAIQSLVASDLASVALLSEEGEVVAWGSPFCCGLRRPHCSQPPHPMLIELPRLVIRLSTLWGLWPGVGRGPFDLCERGPQLERSPRRLHTGGRYPLAAR